MVVTVIFRPMLRGLQPKSKTPVDYRKAFLMTREMYSCALLAVLYLLYLSLLQPTVAILGPLQTTNAVLSYPCRIRCTSLIIFYYTPIAQSPTLRASRAACERVGARVVQMNRKLERLWNSKRSTSISTFRFLSNHGLLRCHRTHHEPDNMNTVSLVYSKCKCPHGVYTISFTMFALTRRDIIRRFYATSPLFGTDHSPPTRR
jgi:hypothetical protein